MKRGKADAESFPRFRAAACAPMAGKWGGGGNGEYRCCEIRDPDPVFNDRFLIGDKDLTLL